MKGTEKYWPYVKTGRYGNLFVETGKHARGNTLHVYVIPSDAKVQATNTMSQRPVLDKPMVEVFGILRGQPGWTEEYGWKHEGPWVEDFERLVESGRLAAEHKVALREVQCEEQAQKEREYRDTVLASYTTGEYAP